MRIETDQEWHKGEMKSYLERTWQKFCGDETIPYLNCGDDYMTCRIIH